MADSHCAFVSGNFLLCPEDIFALCNCSICINTAENRDAAADLSIVYDDKASEIRNQVVIIYDEWRAGLNCNSANVISVQLFAAVACCLQCGRISHLLD